ncbi:hypothetical protein BDV41DRAFT_527239 [Aspergillus transmontanensis]|uniref:Uncharacterized protein n=1 Tax=Aspergillus transmontanensis TaxID=1034304 RepID=A0A5N6W7Z6_9EURO|nr:hypothetical protein BDV41DRAFT_527239 [Aspergillus transmontanensis]
MTMLVFVEILRVNLLFSCHSMPFGILIFTITVEWFVLCNYAMTISGSTIKSLETRI